MKRAHLLSKLVLLVVGMSFAIAAVAQKAGGTLKLLHRDNPSSASLQEETSNSDIVPFTSVFNNLVAFDRKDPIARPETIKPDLATEWSWSADNLVLTLKLREGVKWHDGKPFTSADVQCTWDTIQEKRDSHWRKNPRKPWYSNLKEVTAVGPYEVRFTLGRPQPSFLSFLASGWSVVYPCHVDGAAMRRNPVGTGPFKFAEWKPNDVIRLTKNRDYWKPGRPYLDTVEWRIMNSHATRTLSFVAGQYDVTFNGDVNMNIMKDIRAQAPKAICVTQATNVVGTMLINHTAPPFDNPKVRRAVSLALDRHAFAASRQGNGFIGGAMLSPPYGVWGLTAKQLEALPEFQKNVERNRAQARKLMEEAGYGPKNKVKVNYIMRMNDPPHLTSASLIADQLRNIYIEGEIEQRENSVFVAAQLKGAYTLAFNTSAASVDDPDVVFYQTYTCAARKYANVSKYCNPEVDKKIDEQSATIDPVKRKKLVQELDLLLQREVARPALYQYTSATCWQPYVKGYVRSSNGLYTHNNLEDVWLDR